MSSSGYAKTMIVLDFNAYNGVVAVASPAEGVDNATAVGQAQIIHDRVKKAEQDDYDQYADGRFDFRECVEKQLEVYGAKLLVYYDSEARFA